MILWQFLPLRTIFIIMCSLLCLTNRKELITRKIILDKIGLTMRLIPILILYSLIKILERERSALKLCLILLSCIRGCVCFLRKNFLLFFISYELRIISLLFTLFIKSPYSERSMAGWYFLGYLVLGGVPLLLLFIYFSAELGKNRCLIKKEYVSYGLFIIFITKVPLFPFHAWLPIVHAEAKRFVSIMLSGYIMKLGLLGILRFFKVSCEVLKVYLLVFFTFGCFFFIRCFCELDKKRWLAFLSLGHIRVGMGGTFRLSQGRDLVLSSFRLGHGLSVFIMFLYFYVYRKKSGSRNWTIKIFYNKKIRKTLLIPRILRLIAFPPCILFFNEILIYIRMGKINMLIITFGLYIFLGILGPMCILRTSLRRFSKRVTYPIRDNYLIIILLIGYVFYIIGLIL